MPGQAWFTRITTTTGSRSEPAIDRGDRAIARGEQRQYHERKRHELAQGQYGKLPGQDAARIIDGEVVVHLMVVSTPQDVDLR